MRNFDQLASDIKRMDRKGYPNYKDLRGNYDFNGYDFSIRHVQSDPFASPSDVSVQFKNTFPEAFQDTKAKRIALADCLLRLFDSALKEEGKSLSKKAFSISRPVQQMLERSAVEITKDHIDVRFHMSFPAFGRKIDARGMEALIAAADRAARKALVFDHLSDGQKSWISKTAQLANDQEYIRQYLKDHDLAAFAANGSILPRAAGNSDLPMENAVPFKSPESMEVIIDLPSGKKLSGMGIKKGITLIVGGGYHGKSTLLNALEKGVYNHRLGDGREYVITDSSAIKSRAEDGRRIASLDLSPFIQSLPQNKSTDNFSTQDASGSTSQAASIMEAAESGSSLLLIDEDTSATNFMVRDELMADVISQKEEPIIPFVSRVRQLYDDKGISSILVAGSSGSYFYPADTVIQMDSYKAKDITQKAKEAAAKYLETNPQADSFMNDVPEAAFETKRVFKGSPSLKGDRVKIKARSMDNLQIAREDVDIRSLEQLVSLEQVKAIGSSLKAMQEMSDESRTLEELADDLEKLVDEKGLRALGKSDFARMRKQELMAAASRMRSLDLTRE